MPGDKPFDLPPFTGAWGFVINNVGIYGFLPCCSLWQGTQKSCCQAFNRSQASPGEQPRSSSVPSSSEDQRLLLGDLSVSAGDVQHSHSLLWLNLEEHPVLCPKSLHFK